MSNGEASAMTPAQIDELGALHRAATEGEWHASWRGIGWEVHLSGDPDRCWAPAEPDHPTTHDGQKDTIGDRPEDEALARSIAAAHNAMPALLAAARRVLVLSDALTAVELAMREAMGMLETASPSEFPDDATADAYDALDNARNTAHTALAEITP